MSMRLAVIVTAALLVLAGRVRTATGQMLPPSPGTIVARDIGATMERLAEGVYAIIHERATPDWPHGNTGVIVGEDAVLVVDSDYFPSRAAADIALIRQVTDVPIRYLVNTHWHGDHTHGNGVYRDSFPGLAILGAERTATFFELNQARLPRRILKPGSHARQSIARDEGLLSRGRDSTGRVLSSEERADLMRAVSERRQELAEMQAVQVAPPTHLFDGSLVVDLGRRRVEIRDMGPGNSPADLVIYVPSARVLFAGDLLVYPVPYTTEVFPDSWLRILKELETYRVAALVPGHGPVMSDHRFTRNVREAFEMTRHQLDSLLRLGYTMAEAADSVNLMSLRHKFWVPAGRPVLEPFWRDWVRNLASQFAPCVMGYHC
ncbi:MAG: MBL fold metallo-hydrolase [Gemmatimonadaceae bacterium]|nr:MBL fold metallo-hydrolase [Gemmatimonadaceae bacterium]